MSKGVKTGCLFIFTSLKSLVSVLPERSDSRLTDSISESSVTSVMTGQPRPLSHFETALSLTPQLISWLFLGHIQIGAQFSYNTKHQLKTIQKIEHDLAYMDYAMIFLSIVLLVISIRLPTSAQFIRSAPFLYYHTAFGGKINKRTVEIYWRIADFL